MLELFTEIRTKNVTSFPRWRCPKCKTGVLKCAKDDILKRETTASKNAHQHEAFDFEWIENSFAAFLRCDNNVCGGVLVATGQAGVSERQYYDDQGATERDWIDHYTVSAVVPAPPLFMIKDCVPAKVSDHLEVVFALFWVDYSAALGRLRICIEDILTERKIKRFSNSKGKRVAIQLHDRILAFEKMNSVAAASLMAIKWVGNAGSHAGNLDAVDRDKVIEVLGIFEHALDQIYDQKPKLLGRMIANINKNKGM
jgi:hypothetical protein